MSEIKVPYFRPYLPDSVRQSVHIALDRVLRRGQLSNHGPEVLALEKYVQETWYPDCRVFAVTSGDVGLVIAVAAMAAEWLEPGDRVAVSMFTFQSTANAVLWNRLEPLLFDIRGPVGSRVSYDMDDSGDLDFAECRAAVLTAPFGDTATASKKRWPHCVVDAAHAIGQLPRNSIGDAAVFSLSGTKLATSGEGGLIVVPPGPLGERIAALRNYGFHGDYDAHALGINGKMDELRAAFALASLKALPEHMGARIDLRSAYVKKIAPTLRWSFQKDVDHFTPKDLILWHRERELPHDVVERMAAHGVEVKRYFRPLHLQSAYRQSALRHRGGIVAEAAWRHTLCVPFFAGMRTAEVDHVCAALAEVVG